MMHNDGPFGIPGEIIPCEEISDQTLLSQTPLVSVKMITCNHEPYIAQAIEGVLQQKTDFPLELIIGEDCSTDRTREIVLEYQRKYPAIIRVLISENNVGANKNSRRTYAACRGKYIGYCEGDDYWHHPLKLKKQVEYLEAHLDVGLIHSDVNYYYTEKKRTKRRIFRKYKKGSLPRSGVPLVQSLIMHEYHVVTCSAVVRRILIEKIFSECPYEFSDQFHMGDFQTWIEVANRANFAYLPESLATYSVLSESASRSRDWDKIYRFTKTFFTLSLHYANKYGGNNFNRMQNIIIQNRARLLMWLAYQGRRSEWGNEALALVKGRNVKLTIINRVHFYGSKNIFLYYLVWILLKPREIIMKALSRIKNFYWSAIDALFAPM
ncbi:MAG: glycosyltransferase [Deltaproteobacteria bacterium]|nr:glycosyltransferase [Deltaproteobacteria bacterium]